LAPVPAGDGTRRSLPVNDGQEGFLFLSKYGVLGTTEREVAITEGFDARKTTRAEQLIMDFSPDLSGLLKGKDQRDFKSRYLTYLDRPGHESSSYDIFKGPPRI
jgi:hypothetical protein